MRTFLATMAALTLMSAAGQLWQWQRRAQLQADLAIAREQANELAALQTERQRLLESQVPAAELQRLRDDRAAMARLRNDIETLKQSADAKFDNDAAVQPPSLPSVTEGTVAEQYLRNMGRATPAAALETALWAATGGDIDTLAGLLALEGEARIAAGRILAALPEATRNQYRTPEHLIALLTAQDIPLVGIRITPPRREDPEGTRILARVPAADGKPGTVAVSLRRYGDGWKLVVPRDAVEKYSRKLAGAAASEAAK
jgi:hypothetical protein